MDESKRKINCWEYMRCGREPGGINVETQGTCPAAVEGELNEVHDGKNAGRSCWIVSGTFCAGKIPVTFARNVRDCTDCAFFKKVRAEEGKCLVLNEPLLQKVKSKKD